MTSPNANEVHTGHFFGVKRTAMMMPKTKVTMSAAAITTTSVRNNFGE